MFDIAYQVEMTICVSSKERDRIWDSILSLSAIDLRPSLLFDLAHWRSMLDYAEIFYCTHGV